MYAADHQDRVSCDGPHGHDADEQEAMLHRQEVVAVGIFCLVIEIIARAYPCLLLEDDNVEEDKEGHIRYYQDAEHFLHCARLERGEEEESLNDSEPEPELEDEVELARHICVCLIDAL